MSFKRIDFSDPSGLSVDDGIYFQHRTYKWRFSFIL